MQRLFATRAAGRADLPTGPDLARTRAGRLRHTIVRGLRDDAVVDRWADP